MRFLILTACLFLLWNNPALSKDMIPTGKKLVRFVCQRYDSETNNLMDKIIILDQLSTQTLSGSYTPEITGEMMVDIHRTNIDGKVKGRLRYYDNVSLFDYTSDEEVTVLELTKKEDFDQKLEALLKTQATKSDFGDHTMDYSGTIERFLDFTDMLFEGSPPNKPEPENQIEMGISLIHYNFPVGSFKLVGFRKRPYICDTPFFVEEMIEK